LTFWITESTYGRFLALIVLLSPWAAYNGEDWWRGMSRILTWKSIMIERRIFSYSIPMYFVWNKYVAHYVY
jgi:hypothetical protein